MNGCSALHKKFLMLFIRKASELSAVTSIFIHEFAGFEQLVLSGEYMEGCKVVITSPIPVMLLVFGEKLLQKKPTPKQK